MKNNRAQRANIAKETLQILKQGYYHKNEKRIRLTGLDEAIQEAIWYRPEALEDLQTPFNQDFEKQETHFDVQNCTTFAAAQQLLEEGAPKVLALNFASAKNPGGGFLGGSQAQEEALSRASALYPTLTKHMDMYLENRTKKTCLYSNNMIYSPAVPVFRDDNDALLEEPYALSFVTAAAVNAGCIRKNERKRVSKIQSVMLDRMEKVLTIAASHGYEYLVLGAWGCGVFRNEPATIAELFKEQLTEHPFFKQRFKKVLFGVLDSSKKKETYNAFQKVFA